MSSPSSSPSSGRRPEDLMVRFLVIAVAGPQKSAPPDSSLLKNTIPGGRLPVDFQGHLTMGLE
jgi:hypothetical protein